MPAPTDHLSPRWFGVGLAVAMLLPWAAFAQTPAWPGPEDMARARNAHPFPTPAQIAAQPARPLPQLPTTPATKTTIDIAAMARQGGQLAAPTASATASGTLRIFITLDMPRGSLQRLVDQAARSGAVLVLRGLKAQSLRETLAVVSDLIDKRPVVWVIDPDAYTRYGVTSAPTFVLTLADETAASGPGMPSAKDNEANPLQCGSSCFASTAFVRVAGDVSLDYALEAIAKRSPAAEPRATALLQRMHKP